MKHPFLLALLLLPLGLSSAFGQRRSQTVPVDGERFESSLVSIASGWKATFATLSGDRELPAAELAYWGAYNDTDGSTQLVFVDGSVLVAELLGWDEESIRIESTIWGIANVPRRQVRGILFSPPSDLVERDRLLDRIRGSRPRNDQVELGSGDSVSGRLLPTDPNDNDAFFGLSAFWLELRPGEPAVRIGVDSAVVLLLKQATLSTAVPPMALGGQPDSESPRTPADAGSLAVQPGLESSSKPACLLGFDDGTLLFANKLESGPRVVELTLGSGVRLTSASDTTWTHLIYIQPLGSRIRYLSDLRKEGYRHIPYLQLDWPMGEDRNALRGNLRGFKTIYPKGIGMYSTSRVAYRLDGAYERFEAELAIDRAAKLGGSVIFRVFVKGGDSEGSEWKLAYTSQVIRGGDHPVPIKLDVSSADQMALIVEFADRGDELDYANWLNARLIAPEKGVRNQ